jgi:hypothetical protein
MKLFLNIVVLIFICLTINLSSCAPYKSYINHDDKLVFHDIKKVKSHPENQDYIEKLNSDYEKAKALKLDIIRNDIKHKGKGVRWKETLNNLLVLQEMYEKIQDINEANIVVTNCKDFSGRIEKVKLKGSQEYYELGNLYLSYQTKGAARKAYQFFVDCNLLIEGYKDVKIKLALAKENATTHVGINPVKYYGQGLANFGYDSDFYQFKLISDLNNRSYEFVSFYSTREIKSLNIKADIFVNLTIDKVFVGLVDYQTQRHHRTKQVQIGFTKSIPPKPIYKNHEATVIFNKKYMFAEANMYCSIVKNESNYSLFYQGFPTTYSWDASWGSYTGDADALTLSDWEVIHSIRDPNPPSNREVSRVLLEDSYQDCISAITDVTVFF